MNTSRTSQGITVAVEPHAHETLKRISETKGMKLKAVPSLLAELWELVTPDQIAKATERFEQKRSPDAAPRRNRNREPQTA